MALQDNDKLPKHGAPAAEVARARLPTRAATRWQTIQARVQIKGCSKFPKYKSRSRSSKHRSRSTRRQGRCSRSTAAAGTADAEPQQKEAGDWLLENRQWLRPLARSQLPNVDQRTTATPRDLADATSEELEETLRKLVADAVARIQHLERDWTPEELTRRIVNYIHKAMHDPEGTLASLPWKEGVKHIVTRAWNRLCNACSERQWFHELNLEQSLALAASWHLELYERVEHGNDVIHCVAAELTQAQNHVLFSQGLKRACSDAFSDAGVADRVNRCFLRGFRHICCETAGPIEIIDLVPMEIFLTTWLHDAIGRAWKSLDNAEEVLTKAAVLNLMRGIVQPFDDKSTFSCIPAKYFPSCDRKAPPRNWGFLESTVNTLFHEWEQKYGPATTSRKKKIADKAATAIQPPLYQVFCSQPFHSPVALQAKSEKRRAHAVPKAALRKAMQEQQKILRMATQCHSRRAHDLGELVVHTGHPQCTQHEDCIGNEDSELVRHCMNTKKGDIYCATCWAQLCRQNPELRKSWSTQFI